MCLRMRRVIRTISAKLDDAIPLAITSVVNPVNYFERLGRVTKLLIDATDDEFFMNDVSARVIRDAACMYA